LVDSKLDFYFCPIGTICWFYWTTMIINMSFWQNNVNVCVNNLKFHVSDAKFHFSDVKFGVLVRQISRQERQRSR
jgi:hypothetical protein